MTTGNTDASELLERFRIISELISNFAYSSRIAPDGSVTVEWITDSFTQYAGYTLDEINAGGWQSIIHPDDLHLALEQADKIRAGEDCIYELRSQAREGGTKWVRNYLRPVMDNQHRLIHVHGAAIDITEDKRHMEGKYMLASIVESSDYAILRK